MKLPFWKTRRQRPNISRVYNPESAEIVEIQRLFKTLYSKGRAGGEIKSLMVTSPMPREGKSLIVGCLALVAAHADLRTIIIDADLRRPTQHLQFSISRFPGLSDYLLASEEEYEKTVHSLRLENLRGLEELENYEFILENLKIIPCGSRANSPGGLLHSNPLKIKALLDWCHVEFDVALVDVPPLIPVNDAELIATLVDGVALVVKSGETHREIVERTLEILRKGNCNLLGMILNNITGALPYHYETKYYDYYYHKQTEDSDEI
jgi:Mrp family chromosome partitioning ATPase